MADACSFTNNTNGWTYNSQKTKVPAPGLAPHVDLLTSPAQGGRPGPVPVNSGASASFVCAANPQVTAALSFKELQNNVLVTRTATLALPADVPVGTCSFLSGAPFEEGQARLCKTGPAAFELAGTRDWAPDVEHAVVEPGAGWLAVTIVNNFADAPVQVRAAQAERYVPSDWDHDTGSALAFTIAPGASYHFAGYDDTILQVKLAAADSAYVVPLAPGGAANTNWGVKQNAQTGKPYSTLTYEERITPATRENARILRVNPILPYAVSVVTDVRMFTDWKGGWSSTFVAAPPSLNRIAVDAKKPVVAVTVVQQGATGFPTKIELGTAGSGTFTDVDYTQYTYALSVTVAVAGAVTAVVTVAFDVVSTPDKAVAVLADQFGRSWFMMTVAKTAAAGTFVATLSAWYDASVLDDPFDPANLQYSFPYGGGRVDVPFVPQATFRLGTVNSMATYAEFGVPAGKIDLTVRGNEMIMSPIVRLGVPFVMTYGGEFDVINEADAMEYPAASKLFTFQTFSSVRIGADGQHSSIRWMLLRNLRYGCLGIYSKLIDIPVEFGPYTGDHDGNSYTRDGHSALYPVVAFGDFPRKTTTSGYDPVTDFRDYCADPDPDGPSWTIVYSGMGGADDPLSIPQMLLFRFKRNGTVYALDTGSISIPNGTGFMRLWNHGTQKQTWTHRAWLPYGPFFGYVGIDTTVYYQYHYGIINEGCKPYGGPNNCRINIGPYYANNPTTIDPTNIGEQKETTPDIIKATQYYHTTFHLLVTAAPAVTPTQPIDYFAPCFQKVQYLPNACGTGSAQCLVKATAAGAVACPADLVNTPTHSALLLQDVCQQPYEESRDSVHCATVYGVHARQCSGFLTQEYGRDCGIACAAAPTACSAAINAFCSVDRVADAARYNSADCACVNVDTTFTSPQFVEKDAPQLPVSRSKFVSSVTAKAPPEIQPSCYWPLCVGKTDGKGALIPPDNHCPTTFQSCSVRIADVTVQDSDAVFNAVNDCSLNIAPEGSSLALLGGSKQQVPPAWAIAVLVILAAIIVGTAVAAAWKGFRTSKASVPQLP